jgi:hypothetical protein
MPLVYSFTIKLHRANEHLQSSTAAIDEWIAKKPYSFTDKFDQKRRFNVVTFRRDFGPPAWISPIIGDCLHNLRSSLDHSIFALAQHFNKGPLPYALARKTEFPIFHEFHTPDKFKKKTASKLGHIDPGAQTVIEGLQPYHARDRFKTHWLWLLNELDIIDKHRAFISVAGVQTVFTMRPRDLNTNVVVKATFMKFLGISPFVDEAEVFHYGLPEGHPAMDMDFDSTVKVTFADGPAEGREIISTLSGIRDYLLGIVYPKLIPFLSA